MADKDPMRGMLSQHTEDSIESQAALATLSGFLSHMEAALLSENDKKADRERASAVAAFEALLDLRTEQFKRLIRMAREANKE